MLIAAGVLAVLVVVLVAIGICQTAGDPIDEPSPPRPRLPRTSATDDPQAVGICATCDDDVVFYPYTGVVRCPCGAADWPTAFSAVFRDRENDELEAAYSMPTYEKGGRA